MNITVLNGSPKGKYSITFQNIRFLEKHFPQLNFQVFHIGEKIKTMERDLSAFNSVMDSVAGCDCVIWCYPVFTFLVPYQLMRFIELIFHRDRNADFSGKYTVQMLTSRHFYDHTAINYLQAVCEDLEMKHLPAFSSGMEDLTKNTGRENLLTFGTFLFRSFENRVPVCRKFNPVSQKPGAYIPLKVRSAGHISNKHKIVLITDNTDPESNIGKMIETYTKLIPSHVDIVNLADFPFRGGCLECLHCTIEGRCIYTDDFDSFHKNHIQTADCIIYAAEIHRHWLSSTWKCFFDRLFYNGHRSSMMGKSAGYIISGPLKNESNLRETLEARIEVEHLYLLDIVTDEYDSVEEITALLKNLAETTMWAVQTKPQRPLTFLGVGGMKVFRDLIFTMRGLMSEDHRFFKKHHLYDFPHKQKGTILKGYVIGFLMKSKKLRKKAVGVLKQGILKQYESIIDKY